MFATCQKHRRKLLFSSIEPFNGLRITDHIKNVQYLTLDKLTDRFIIEILDFLPSDPLLYILLLKCNRPIAIYQNFNYTTSVGSIKQKIIYSTISLDLITFVLFVGVRLCYYLSVRRSHVILVSGYSVLTVFN